MVIGSVCNLEEVPDVGDRGDCGSRIVSGGSSGWNLNRFVGGFGNLGLQCSCPVIGNVEVLVQKLFS